MLKKIPIIMIILIFILNITCFADDITEDTIIDKNIIDESIETSSILNTIPSINSRSAIVIDRNSKTILFRKDENSKRAMASTTKIMTALIVIENTNLDTTIEISKKAAGIGGSRLKISAGDNISIRDLLYGLMLRSGNDAAIALAEYVGGNIENFVDMMNKKAYELNLQNTHFVTPHGLDEKEHYTTAYELAILTDYALKNETFSKIVQTKTANITINGQNKTISNTNELLGNLNGVYGVKTGFTNGAGRCLVTSIKRDNMDIICVVLGADTKKDRTKDSVKLIEYIFKNYEITSLNSIINESFESWNKLNTNRIHIEKGLDNNLNLILDLNNKEILYPILRNSENEINVKIISDFNLKAPITSNTKMGKLQIFYKDEIIREINIVNTNSIKKKNINYYLFEFTMNYNTYLEKVL